MHRIIGSLTLRYRYERWWAWSTIFSDDIMPPMPRSPRFLNIYLCMQVHRIKSSAKHPARFKHFHFRSQAHDTCLVEAKYAWKSCTAYVYSPWHFMRDLKRTSSAIHTLKFLIASISCRWIKTPLKVRFQYLSLYLILYSKCIHQATFKGSVHPRFRLRTAT